MSTTTEEKAEKRRKYLEWEARKIAEDPMWKVRKLGEAKARAKARYESDPQYKADTIRRAKERQARRTMSGEHQEYHKQYRVEHREEFNKYQRERARKKYAENAEHREKRKAAMRAESQTPEYKARMRGYRAKKRATDPNFKIAENCRRRINYAIAGKDKSASTLVLLGCSILELKNHLESLWQPGMNWTNYNYRGWHIDHKRCCDSFDLSDPAQQARCFHYTNLQPMWREHNQSKGSREAPRPNIIPAELDVI